MKQAYSLRDHIKDLSTAAAFRRYAMRPVSDRLEQETVKELSNKDVKLDGLGNGDNLDQQNGNGEDLKQGANAPEPFNEIEKIIIHMNMTYLSKKANEREEK